MRAGQPGGGQWTTGGNGVSYDSGSVSADNVRNNPANIFTQVGSVIPMAYTATQAVADNIFSNRAASITAIPVTLNDGSRVIDPATGKAILMPSNVSLQANADYGEGIRDFPSVADGPSYPTVFYFPLAEADLEEPDYYSSKEYAMISQFWPGNPMDYQRISSTLTDSNGNPIIDRAYVNFGNFNYGIVAAAAGYTLDQTLAGAAALNQYHALTNPNIDTSGTYGGNARNEYFIRMGYNAYASGKIKGSQ